MAAKGTETARTHSDLMCVKRQSQAWRGTRRLQTTTTTRSGEMTLKEIFKPKVFGQLGRGKQELVEEGGRRKQRATSRAIVVKLNSN